LLHFIINFNMMKQRTFILCLLANVLTSTCISAAAFGRFRSLPPGSRNHDEYNDNDHDDNDKASRKNTQHNNDLVDDKRRRQRQQFQRQQNEYKEESSWLDGMELEEDYPIPPSDDNNDHDHDEYDYHDALDAQQTHPLLQIPCAMHVHLPDDGNNNNGNRARSQPVRTFCDTGAQRTVMSWDCAQRTGLLQHLDRRYAGQACGVGSCRVLGRIPAGIGRLTLNGRVSIPSPAISVLESTNGGNSGSDNDNSNDSHDATAGVELLLGLDFLREHDAILNLRTEELQLIVDDRDNDDCSDGSDCSDGNHSREVRIPFIRPRSPSSRGGTARGGASSSATGTATTTTRRRSSSNSNAGDDRDNSRTTRVYRHSEWEGEEDDDEEDDDVSDIDMSGV
jgi:hypothetical protein